DSRNLRDEVHDQKNLTQPFSQQQTTAAEQSLRARSQYGRADRAGRCYQAGDLLSRNQTLWRLRTPRGCAQPLDGPYGSAAVLNRFKSVLRRFMNEQTETSETPVNSLASVSSAQPGVALS